MSAFVSVRLPDSVQLLADGAAYDAAGIVTSFENKIRVSKRVPVAIAVRGASGLALLHADLLCELADDEGVEGLLDALHEYATSLKIRRHLKQDPVFGFDFAVAVWHPETGPAHYRIHGCDGIHGFAPFVLHELGDLVACGANFPGETLYRLGILPVRKDGPTWGRTKGGEIMDLMRGLKGEPLAGDMSAEAFRIGGHVDVASVTAAGVTVRRIRQWGDKVGELINPFRQEQTVIGNRKQRRAAKGRAA